MCDWNHPLKLWQERNVLVWNSEEVERRGGGLHYTELFTATRLLNVLGFYGTLPSLSDPWVIYCANSFWTPPSLIRLKSCQFGYVHWSIFYLFFFPHKIKNKSKKKKHHQTRLVTLNVCRQSACLLRGVLAERRVVWDLAAVLLVQQEGQGSSLGLHMRLHLWKCFSCTE